MSEQLAAFLAGHSAFSEVENEWLGVALRHRFYLGRELPSPAYIGSVRGVVLKADQVLLVHSPAPILTVGGRPDPGESIAEALVREVGEESGWVVAAIGIIGFVHSRHLDDQRPDWGRPAPDWLDPIFAVEAQAYDGSLLLPDENGSEMVPIKDVARRGVDEVNRAYLTESLRIRASGPDQSKSKT